MLWCFTPAEDIDLWSWGGGGRFVWFGMFFVGVGLFSVFGGGFYKES